MKNNLILRVLLVLSVLLMGVQFIGCSNDDDSGPVPIASFTFTATNNQNAPTTVSFSNEIQIDVDYNWDFGNGETFFGRDPVITYTKEGTYTVQLTASGEGGTAQMSEDIVVGSLTVTEELLDGIWSVVRQEITPPGSSTPIIRESPMNWETLDYSSSGVYQRVSFDWIELEGGTYTIDKDVITQTPTSGVDDFTPVEILITYIDDEEILAEIDMEESGEIIHIKATLRKNGAQYYGQGEFPRHSLLDFAGNKWSILEETTTKFTYSPEDDEYTSILSTETVTDIPYNFKTFFPIPGSQLSLYIDNWEEGVYQNYYSMVEIRPYSSYKIIEEQGGPQLFLLIDNNLDDNNIETISVVFGEENGEQVKIEYRTKLIRNDGSEPTITETELIGQWKVTAKTEIKDGVDVDPQDSYTPPLDFVLSFNADGSAALGDPDPGSWFLLDESNFVVVSPEGDETLVHVVGFNSSSAELTAFGKWIDDGAVFEMTLSLEKQ
ncbi:MAG: PKD domain-containing protein [Cyclobacteriaceae bacterium]